MRYYPCLHQAIHSLLGSDIYVTIALIVDQVIFVYNLLVNEFENYLVIFGLLHWIFQVEVIDIYNKVFSVRGGDDAVPM